MLIQALEMGKQYSRFLRLPQRFSPDRFDLHPEPTTAIFPTSIALMTRMQLSQPETQRRESEPAANDQKG
jgi:hypothetical protein